LGKRDAIHFDVIDQHALRTPVERVIETDDVGARAEAPIAFVEELHHAG
jgi:hypothetical protein